MKAILMVILIAVILAGGYFGILYTTNTVRSRTAEKKGQAFVAKLYKEYSVIGSSCQGDDTDKDSYVSCDFRLQSSGGVERVIHLQCPVLSKIITGSSCKESRAVIQ